MKAYIYDVVWIHSKNPPAACSHFPSIILSMKPQYWSVFTWGSRCQDHHAAHSNSVTAIMHLSTLAQTVWTSAQQVCGKSPCHSVPGTLQLSDSSRFSLHSLFLIGGHPFLQTVPYSRPWKGVILWFVQCKITKVGFKINEYLFMHLFLYCG